MESAMHYIREMCNGGSAIKPHVRTFAPMFRSDIDMPLHRFVNLIQAIRHYNLVPSKELFSEILGCFPKKYSIEDVFCLLDWISKHHKCVPKKLAENLGKHFNTTPTLLDHISEDGVSKLTNEKLPLLRVDSKERKAMRESLHFKGKDAIRGFLKDKKIDIVVDGANVALFNNSPFRWEKVEKVIQKIGKEKKILVVFHIGRKKQAKGLLEKVKSMSNVSVFFTKENEDDDNTWLYATLKGKKAICITADRMTDHLYYKFKDVVGKEVFEKWCDNHIVPYKFGRNFEGEVEIYWPLPYSLRVSYSNNYIYVPVESTGVNSVNPVNWYCIKYA